MISTYFLQLSWNQCQAGLHDFYCQWGQWKEFALEETLPPTTWLTHVLKILLQIAEQRMGQLSECLGQSIWSPPKSWISITWVCIFGSLKLATAKACLWLHGGNQKNISNLATYYFLIQMVCVPKLNGKVQYWRCTAGKTHCTSGRLNICHVLCKQAYLPVQLGNLCSYSTPLHRYSPTVASFWFPVLLHCNFYQEIFINRDSTLFLILFISAVNHKWICLSLFLKQSCNLSERVCCPENIPFYALVMLQWSVL